jgi:hypothetical protein
MSNRKALPDPLAPRDNGKRRTARIKQEKHSMSVKAAEVSRRFQALWARKELRARSSSLLWLCQE